jgi:hypothetical protein
VLRASAGNRGLPSFERTRRGYDIVAFVPPCKAAGTSSPRAPALLRARGMRRRLNTGQYILMALLFWLVVVPALAFLIPWSIRLLPSGWGVPAVALLSLPGLSLLSLSLFDDVSPKQYWRVVGCILAIGLFCYWHNPDHDLWRVLLQICVPLLVLLWLYGLVLFCLAHYFWPERFPKPEWLAPNP